MSEICEKLIKYIQLKLDQEIINSLQSILLIRDDPAQAKQVTFLNKYIDECYAYYLEAKSALEKGQCHGLSLVYNFMAKILKKQKWWDNALAAIFAWDEKELDKEVDLVDSINKHETIDTILFRCLNYILFYQFDLNLKDNNAPKYPNLINFALESMNYLKALESPYFEYLDEDKKTHTTFHALKTAGHFTADEIVRMILSNKMDGICLIYNDNHCITLMQIDNHWEVYNSSTKIKKPPFTTSHATLNQAVQKIISILGSTIVINMASPNHQIFLPLPITKENLQHGGLLLILKNINEFTPSIFALAEQSKEYTNVLANELNFVDPKSGSALFRLMCTNFDYFLKGAQLILDLPDGLMLLLKNLSVKQPMTNPFNTGESSAWDTLLSFDIQYQNSIKKVIASFLKKCTDLQLASFASSITLFLKSNPESKLVFEMALAKIEQRQASRARKSSSLFKQATPANNVNKEGGFSLEDSGKKLYPFPYF